MCVCVCRGRDLICIFQDLSMEDRLWEGKSEARTSSESIALFWAADREDLNLGSDCAYRNERIGLRYHLEVNPTRLG